MTTERDPADEITIEANEKTYRLYYGNRAFRLAELKMEKPWLQANTDLRQDVTILIWAGLQQHHPELTLEETDELIDAVGFGNVMTVATRAMVRAAGGKEAPEGNAQRPPRRGRGRSTGSDS